jgi:hypothetical protein
MPVGIRLCRYARNEWMTQIFEKKRRVLQMTNASSHNLTKSRPDFQRVASLVWSQVLALRDVPPSIDNTHTSLGPIMLDFQLTCSNGVNNQMKVAILLGFVSFYFWPIYQLSYGVLYSFHFSGARKQRKRENGMVTRLQSRGLFHSKRPGSIIHAHIHTLTQELYIITVLCRVKKKSQIIS